jgi:hypothetical protein
MKEKGFGELRMCLNNPRTGKLFADQYTYRWPTAAFLVHQFTCSSGRWNDLRRDTGCSFHSCDTSRVKVGVMISWTEIFCRWTVDASGEI